MYLVLFSSWYSKELFSLGAGGALEPWSEEFGCLISKITSSNSHSTYTQNWKKRRNRYLLSSSTFLHTLPHRSHYHSFYPNSGQVTFTQFIVFVHMFRFQTQTELLTEPQTCRRQSDVNTFCWVANQQIWSFYINVLRWIWSIHWLD
jgi:hypothetical protein